MKYKPTTLPDALQTSVDRARLTQSHQLSDVIGQIGNMVIRDLRVHPNLMLFSAKDGTKVKPLRLQYFSPSGEQKEEVAIHPHALRQLCSKVSFPAAYLKTLSTHERGRQLLQTNLNELFDFDTWTTKDERKIKFLHRLVDGELRGFISRRFNRHLLSKPMLHAFSVACEEVGAVPEAASSNDVRFRVKAALPWVYEPLKNLYAMVGVEWSNSDFGAGALEVTTFMRLIPVGYVTFGGFRRVHIGSVTDTTDEGFEEAQFSEETYQAEVETQSLAIRDAVVAQLKDDRIESLLDSVVEAYDTRLPWSEVSSRLKTVAGTKAVDTLKAALDDGIEELPSVTKDGNGVPQPTRFWAMAACSWLAANEQDADKRAALEAVGGSMLMDKAA